LNGEAVSREAMRGGEDAGGLLLEAGGKLLGGGSCETDLGELPKELEIGKGVADFEEIGAKGGDVHGV